MDKIIISRGTVDKLIEVIDMAQGEGVGNTEEINELKEGLKTFMQEGRGNDYHVDMVYVELKY